MIQFASTVLYVSDVREAMRFFAEAFDFSVSFLDEDVRLPGRIDGIPYQFGELRMAGGTIQFATPALGALLMPGFPANEVSSAVELAFYTDNVGAAFQRAVKAGADPLRTPERMPWGQEVAYLRSPQRTFIALCTPPAVPGGEALPAGHPGDGRL